MHKALCMLVLIGVGLSGCVLHRESNSSVALKEVTVVDSALTQAAEKIAEDYQQLVQMQAVPVARPVYSAPKDGELAQPISFQWIGPIEPAVRLLADRLGYHYRVLGTSPAPAPVVRIDADKKPFFMVLEELGWQVGDRVEISLSEPEREIVLTYPGGR
jgi:hypothetical protein